MNSEMTHPTKASCSPSTSGEIRRAGARSLAAVLLVPMAACMLLSSAVAQIQGDTELLAEIARRHRANKERIATWQGRVKVTDSLQQPKGSEQSQTASVEFVWDVASARERWNWRFESAWIRQGDGPRQPQQRHLESGVLKDGAYFWLSITDRTNAAMIVVDAPAEANKTRGPFSPALHPEYWFGPEGTNVDTYFQSYYDQRDHPRKSVVSVTRRGDVVIVEAAAAFRDGTKAINRSEVSLSQGGTMVRFFASDKVVEGEWLWEHEQVSGVWVPKKISVKIEQKSLGTTNTREMTWLESIVNEPVTDEAFSIPAMEAQPGDVVSDRRSGVQYTLSAEDFSSGSPGGSAWGRWLLVVVLGLILPALTLGALLWARARKRAAGGTA